LAAVEPQLTALGRARQWVRMKLDELREKLDELREKLDELRR